MQSALVPVHVLSFLLVKKSVWAPQKGTLPWCVWALIMNTGVAISFKVPTLI